MKGFGLFQNKEENDIINSQKDKEEEKLDKEVIKYIINEFPEIGKDINYSLMEVIGTIDRAINTIEDKSNEVIKEYRDYMLAAKYRDISIKLYNISKNINEYINWMDNNLKKDLVNDKLLDNDTKVHEETKDLERKIEDNELLIKSINDDFTTYEPIKIKLDTYEEIVEGWEDTIIKTADILTKKFKNEKNLKFNNSNKIIEIVSKKSKQNDSRDIIIEMLKDHNISLNNYKVFIKK